MNTKKMFVLGMAMISALIMTGCDLLGIKDLAEAEVASFIRESFEGFDDTVGYTMTGEENGSLIEAKSDGINMYMKGTDDGEVMEIYFIGGDTYSYTVVPGFGAEAMWIKYPASDDTESIMDDFSEEFTDEDLTDEEIENEFTYVGKADCPDGINGTCYEFEVDNTIMYFDAIEKKVVKMVTEEMTIVFDYDNKVVVELPEEAKDAQSMADLYSDQFSDLEDEYGIDLDDIEGLEDFDF